MLLDQCVSAVGEVKVPVFVRLRSSCCDVTEVGWPLRSVRLALKVVTQNDGDFCDCNNAV